MTKLFAGQCSLPQGRNDLVGVALPAAGRLFILSIALAMPLNSIMVLITDMLVALGFRSNAKITRRVKCQTPRQMCHALIHLILVNHQKPPVGQFEGQFSGNSSSLLRLNDSSTLIGLPSSPDRGLLDTEEGSLRGLEPWSSKGVRSSRALFATLALGGRTIDGSLFSERYCYGHYRYD